MEYFQYARRNDRPYGIFGTITCVGGVGRSSTGPVDRWVTWAQRGRSVLGCAGGRASCVSSTTRFCDTAGIALGYEGDAFAVCLGERMRGSVRFGRRLGGATVLLFVFLNAGLLLTRVLRAADEGAEITIDTPTNGATVHGTDVKVRVSLGPDVSSARLSVDGGVDLPSTGTLEWNSTIAANGKHTLTVRGFQAGGTSPIGQASVSVDVQNSTHSTAAQPLGFFATLPSSATLPTGKQCAAMIAPTPEMPLQTRPSTISSRQRATVQICREWLHVHLSGRLHTVCARDGKLYRLDRYDHAMGGLQVWNERGRGARTGLGGKWLASRRRGRSAYQAIAMRPGGILEIVECHDRYARRHGGICARNAVSESWSHDRPRFFTSG